MILISGQVITKVEVQPYQDPRTGVTSRMFEIDVKDSSERSYQTVSMPSEIAEKIEEGQDIILSVKQIYGISKNNKAYLFNKFDSFYSID